MRLPVLGPGSLWSRTDQRRERGDGQHLREVGEGEDPTIGVAYDRTERVIHPRPTDASQYGEQGDTAESYRLVMQPLEPQRLVACSPAVTRPLALQQGAERVALVIDDKSGAGVASTPKRASMSPWPWLPVLTKCTPLSANSASTASSIKSPRRVDFASRTCLPGRPDREGCQLEDGVRYQHEGSLTVAKQQSDKNATSRGHTQVGARTPLASLDAWRLGDLQPSPLSFSARIGSI